MMRRKRKRKTRPRWHRIEGQERKDAVVQRGLLRVWVGCTCTCTRSRSYSFTTSFCNTSFVLQFQFQKPLFKFSNFSSLALTHCKLVPSALPLTQPSSSRKDFDFVVVNFYHFVFIQDPQAEVAKHRSFLELEYSGPSKDAMAYVNWLRKDNRFSNILVQISPSEKGHTFPILKLRYKSSLVQFEGGMSHLSFLDPSMRAMAYHLQNGEIDWKQSIKLILLEKITQTEITFYWM
uniref:Uncharacterized protein n=1 Tax=Glycine max TaxID=3847 RepID=A0A0R0IHK5_SOYBN